MPLVVQLIGFKHFIRVHSRSFAVFRFNDFQFSALGGDGKRMAESWTAESFFKSDENRVSTPIFNESAAHDSAKNPPKVDGVGLTWRHSGYRVRRS